ncbi:hypothetical protein D3C78_1023240 [compost metagenome]
MGFLRGCGGQLVGDLEVRNTILEERLPHELFGRLTDAADGDHQLTIGDDFDAVGVDPWHTEDFYLAITIEQLHVTVRAC